MDEVTKSRRVWARARELVIAHPDPTGLIFPRGRLPHPRDAGARQTMTWPVGQVADYAIDGAPGQAPLMIREFPAHWHAFLPGAQGVSATLAKDEQAASSVPFVAAAGAAMLGGALGASLTNKRAGVLLGAGVGVLLVALLTAALDEEQPEGPKRVRSLKGKPK